MSSAKQKAEAREETEDERETSKESGDSSIGRSIPEDEGARRETARERRTETEADRHVLLKVFRYDPEVEAKEEPRFDDFRVPYSRGMTVLDALIYARDHYDSSLTFRHSCRQAVCGSDALFINGQQRLGCQTQVDDLDEPVRVEPLPHQEVIKDLVTDMEHFYEQMHAVEPYFQPDELPDGEHEEQRQSPENREKIKKSTRCIWCGACMSSCNIVQGDQYYLGPAPIVKGYRFYMDEREGEEAKDRRLDILTEEHGVWRCQTQFSCTEVCPKDIPITEHIQEMKREGIKRDIRFWED